LENIEVIEKPMRLEHIDQKFDIKQIVTGARHTLILDKTGKIHAMGDNSSD